MAEEKFISIDYATWNTKYKPMEERLTKTLTELHQEKESKKHTLYLKVDDRTCWGHEFHHDRIRFNAEGYYYDRGYKILEFEPVLYSSEVIDSAIVEKIKSYTKNYSRDNHMVTFDMLEQHKKDIQHELAVIKEARQNLENRLKSVPKLFRWLFKIKL